MGLEQKHVIAVKVRPHAPAIGGIADHHIVQSCIGHKTELLHQRMDAVVVRVHTLHQKSPFFLAEWRQTALRKWPMLHLPTLGRINNQARLHPFLPSQSHQF